MEGAPWIGGRGFGGGGRGFAGGGRGFAGGGGGGGDSGFRVPKALQLGSEDDRDAQMQAAHNLLTAKGVTLSHPSPTPMPRPPPNALKAPVPKPDLGDLAQRARERKERNHESAMLRVRELCRG